MPESIVSDRWHVVILKVFSFPTGAEVEPESAAFKVLAELQVDSAGLDPSLLKQNTLGKE